MLVYADGVNMLGENLQTIRENTEIFIKVSEDIGLEVSLKRLNIWSHIANKIGYSTKSKYSRPNWKFII